MATLQQFWSFFFIFTISFVYTGNAQLHEYPPSYSSDKLPITRFTCEGKHTGRYYADSDTDCQMFHICAKMSRREISDFKFLCPNGTVFDQEQQVCADYYQVVCHSEVGTNPLGHVFEILKINSKESTNKREFGIVPAKDPEYLGQNNLGGEEFQAEEYNNNKLASSRNSIQFQNHKLREPIYYSPTTSKTTTTTARPRTIATTQRAFVSTTTQTPSTLSRRVIENTFPRIPKAQKIPNVTDRRDEFSRFYTSTVPTTNTQYTTPYKPSAVPVSTDRPPSIFDQPSLRFNDFASLSKFQSQFHKSLVSNKPSPSVTTVQSTPEPYTTTTYSPFVEYTDNNLVFAQTYPESGETTTTRKPIFSFNFKTKGTSKRPGTFEFTNTQTTTEYPSTINLDFNTRPRSETQTPFDLSQTTKRPQIYQNTFRTTYQDVTTPGPQSFKQQPTHFNEEFFRKIVAQTEEFSRNDDEDDFYANAQFNPTSSTEDSSEIPTTTIFTTTTSTTPRPLRRRRPNPNRQRNLISESSRHKFSRRVEGVRFEDKRQRVGNNDEIFKAEASVHNPPTSFNSFTNSRRIDPISEVKLEELSSTTPSSDSYRRDIFYGRKVRPSNGRENFEEDTREFKQFRERVVIKRRRTRPTSTTTEASVDPFTPTTYRPPSHSNISNSSSPTLISVTSKVTSIKKSKSSEENYTKSPDYDYTYYDTDFDRQLAAEVASRNEKYGRRSKIAKN